MTVDESVMLRVIAVAVEHGADAALAVAIEAGLDPSLHVRSAAYLFAVEATR